MFLPVINVCIHTALVSVDFRGSPPSLQCGVVTPQTVPAQTSCPMDDSPALTPGSAHTVPLLNYRPRTCFVLLMEFSGERRDPAHPRSPEVLRHAAFVDSAVCFVCLDRQTAGGVAFGSRGGTYIHWKYRLSSTRHAD